jgi:MoaE-MoaD fusion protein
MQVRVLFFGMLKELAGAASDPLELPEGATVADLLVHCEEKTPKLKESLHLLAVAVNQQFAGPETRLSPGDEVALLPPVSGGSGESCKSHAAIVREQIETVSILADLNQPEDGAVVVFEGVVRNQSRGRKTLYLEYEAYDAMALRQMEQLATQALNQFPIRYVAIIHRLGRLDIGEISVLIVVASAHRAAAFDGCRWLIDTLKRTVPIWKKEHFEDGAVWVDGEPFPAEIPRVQGSPPSSPASK